mmetsp:Transcript_24008/g.67074  ORF Transcript_24008/g.67074 Transcript_24008/m.67074 type:complete len:88 (-) Transcript_24008:176-439(-)|eukprot:CAMPEP_0198108556 /NCGR_PEP_ID=MMETSP1442-20131203/624_1 /TAXON_ID= /ORGANISM="Craspedostauros australis, Strain CCMP3328" /LENGTH=87 /DNA_ID=CAMNT_0043763865 /DNA_START=135 /DNA_END=398 /DNA_ORIENTATION=+
MFRTIFLIALLIAAASAFAPATFGVRDTNTVCFAKHVNDKAAKWAKSKRPRKSRPSDINRKPIIYELTSIEKPPEYIISDEPAVKAD